MIKGNIPVIWDEQDYKKLNWVLPEPDKHEEKFNATVDITKYQVGVSMCYENLPKVLLDAGKMFELEKTVVAVNKLEPGQILPFHRDKFAAYKKRNNILDSDNIIRIIVFLHDQKAGHQLWINDEICLGNAGSYFGWLKDTEHMAANLGHEDRYIMQITGVDNGKKE